MKARSVIKTYVRRMWRDREKNDWVCRVMREESGSTSWKRYTKRKTVPKNKIMNQEAE